MAKQQFTLNWKNHQSHVCKGFSSLLNNNNGLTDVTLYCEGQKIEAHRVVLSVCSSYFHNLFENFAPNQHPILIITPGVDYDILVNILQFIYKGEARIDNSKMEKFLQVAQMFEVSGLMDIENKQTQEDMEDNDETQIDDEEPEVFSEPFTNSITYNQQRGVKRSLDSQLERQEELVQADNEAIPTSSIKTEPWTELSENELNAVDPLENSFTHADNNREEPDGSFYYEDGSEICTSETEVTERVNESPSNSKTDIKVRHFPEHSLTCTVCGKIFSHPYSLHHHKAVHAGSTKCGICNTVLSRKYNLKMHMRARHNVDLGSI